MTEEKTRPHVNAELEAHDPSLDHDDHDDANKGATIGGIGGAVTGAVVGSMAGPIGTIAGAVIGGIVCAATSRAAVGAIDRIEHDHAAHAHPPIDAAPVTESAAPPPPPREVPVDPDVQPVPSARDEAPTGTATAYTPDSILPSDNTH